MENKSDQKSFYCKGEKHISKDAGEVAHNTAMYRSNYDDVAHQLSYHTLASKTNCEKRDFNNIPLLINASQPLGYDDKYNKHPSGPNLNEENTNFACKDHRRITNLFYQGQPFNDRNREVDDIDRPHHLASTDGEKTSWSAICHPFVCRINLNTIICLISCLVSFYCLWTTKNLSVRFKARIINLTTSC